MPQGYFEHGQGMHGGGLGWAIFALLLILVLLVLTQLLLSAWRPRFAGARRMHGGPPWHGPDPGAIARMPYARGEISRDEYVQLTQDLGGEPAPPPPAA
jgi:uncharacterized membrane protein